MLRCSKTQRVISPICKQIDANMLDACFASAFQSISEGNKQATVECMLKLNISNNPVLLTVKSMAIGKLLLKQHNFPFACSNLSGSADCSENLTEKMVIG